MNENIVEFITERLRQYADIPDKELNILSDKLKTVNVSKNDFYLRQGDSVSNLGLIYSGFLRIYCIDSMGNEKTLSFRAKGQFVAGYSPYIENKKIWYSIQALEDSEIICITFNDYKALEKGHPCWNELIKNYIIELFIEKENRERSLLLEDARTRYLNFLKDYPDYEKKISQYHIASYLGITPVSLSRIRATLKKT